MQNTLLKEKPPISRYESSLAEFPIFLLSKHPIKDLDCIEYSDSIMVDNKPVERSWRISWSEKYGPGTQSTHETFFALYQILADSGFKSPWIHFGSIYSLLKRKGIGVSSNVYKRTIRDLHCLCNIYIEAKNAFYDSDRKKYVDVGFHLFETLVLEKNSPAAPDPSSKGFIKTHDILFEAARKNSFLLDIDPLKYFKLPGIQQRLFHYLKKMFIFQRFHIRNVSDFARQIPLYSKSKKKVKQQIKKAAKSLLASDLIPTFSEYSFYTSPAGEQMVRFDRADAIQADLFDDDKKDIIEYNFGLITEICKDTHSFPFYKKVASVMPTEAIYRALSETKDFANTVRRNGQECSIPKIFTSRIRSIAQERGVEL